MSIASQTMESLTTGIFLVGIALHLQASNWIIGLLAAIPFISNLFQILGIHLIDTYHDRRKITGLSAFIGRSFLLGIVIVPFIHDRQIALTLLVGCIAIRYSIGAISGCAWNSWMRDLVPRQQLGRFFGKRMFYLSIIAALLTLGSAGFIDWWEGTFPSYKAMGYSLLYGVGLIAGIISSFMIFSIPHPAMPLREIREYGEYWYFSHLQMPFRDGNFKKLMLFLLSWSFAINLAAPFFTVYMLKKLEYDMATVIIMSLLSQIVNAFFLRFWGIYVDRHSNKTILGICGTLFIFSILAWALIAFSPRYSYTVHLLLILHGVMGMATAGVTLSSGNIALKLAPNGDATTYLAINAILSSTAAGLAPLVGGSIADAITARKIQIAVHWYSNAGNIVQHYLTIEAWGGCVSGFFYVGAVFPPQAGAYRGGRGS